MNETPRRLSESGDWRTESLRWLFHQGPSTVLLTLILGAIAYGGYYSMTTAIPGHLKQIQDGYERVTEQMESGRDKDRDAYMRIIEGRATGKLNKETARIE